ncbi:cytochrome P450 4C1-like isoform X2 [Daktulosphaira vitifoliae]|uniref:cytochrome P450 4C1-like isoform X2 n=1 Tax=Daktulosphaira vitifoliae TaxID=58002 RepID=UPI0021AA5C6A|nr:cytochrome P450 4C1-like isoform X2 [Daktulosphaira vitifoliae]
MNMMKLTLNNYFVYLSKLDRLWQKKTELSCYAVFLVLIIFWCRIKWNRRFIDRFAAKLPGPQSYPLIGSGLEFTGTLQQIMDKIIQLTEKFGSEPFKVWLGSTLAVMLTKPEDLEIIFNSSKALKKDEIYNFLINILGEGLSTAPVYKWKQHRKIITPIFNTSFINQLLPIFNKKTSIFIRNLQKELGKTETFDIFDYIISSSVDTICETSMGYNCDTQSDDKFVFSNAINESTKVICSRMCKPWLYPNFIFNIYAKITGWQQICKKCHELPDQIIKEKKFEHAQRKTMENTSKSEKNRFKVFLDKLLELNDQGANFSDKDLKDQVLTMMIAGSETSALTISFCILMLAIHQDIQDKVYDEIYEVMGNGDQTLTIEDTVNFVYLEQCIKETIRLYPIFPIILRRVQEDTKITNHIIPKGTTIAISSIGTHRLPEFYPKPWEFNPENFNPENVAKRHKYSFTGFSGGPRNCIGMKYAMLSMKVTLSTFLRNYSVHTNCKMSDIKLKFEVLMKSVYGYPVTIRPRVRTPSYQI